MVRHMEGCHFILRVTETKLLRAGSPSGSDWILCSLCLARYDVMKSRMPVPHVKAFLNYTSRGRRRRGYSPSPGMALSHVVLK